MQGADDAKDLEMQLLTPAPASSDGDGSSARQILHRAILVVKSVQIFLAGSDHGRSPSVSRASSSKSLNVRIDHLSVCPTSMSSLQPWSPMLVQHQKLLIMFIMANLVQQESEVTQASNGLASSPEHHIDINQLQRTDNKTILEIVRQKDLKALQEYGGLSRVAVALGTDLDQGIFENEVINSRLQTSSLSPVPTHTIFHFVWVELLNKTVLLLSLIFALSLVIGIYEEGLENGWYDGVVVLIAIVLLVFFGSMRKYCQERRAYKKLEKLRSTEVRTAGVWVIRGGETKHIRESMLVYGDVVLLKTGCQVPGDGLFIHGQAVELDYGSESCLIDEQNPFLSYGERVINGEARMVVTSTSTS